MLVWYPQLSTRKGFEFDSNFHIIMNLFYDDGKDTILLWPKQHAQGVELIKKYVPSIEVKLIDYAYPYYAERFFLDRVSITEVFQKYDVDFIVTNEPTHVMTFKSILKDVGLAKKAKIITYQHWVDFFDRDSDVTYYFRQIEGYYTADAVFTNSKVMKNQLLRQARILGNSKLVKKIKQKIKVFYPPVRFDLFDAKKNEDLEPIIVYADRSSDFVDYAIAEKRFKDIMAELGLKYQRFYSLPYEEYFNVLKNPQKLFVLVQTFTVERTWSIVAADFVSTGNIALVPNHSCYREVFCPKSKLLYNDDDELKQKLLDPLLLVEEAKKQRLRLKRKISSPVARKRLFKILDQLRE